MTLLASSDHATKFFPYNTSDGNQLLHLKIFEVYLMLKIKFSPCLFEFKQQSLPHIESAAKIPLPF
jgi:hypothetical protein